ncbi:MAG: DUF4197 domain-containing protein [Steroidobacteraceae bacterium]
MTMQGIRRTTTAVGLSSLSLLLVCAAAHAASVLDAFSQTDSTSALRETLTQGASRAIAKLGIKDGFLGNPEVRIPLPGKLAKARSLLKLVGMDKQADDLVVAMNRSAEAAVPEAAALFKGAITRMTVTDAKQILTGGDDAATQYFRRATEADLRTRFQPIVRKTTAGAELASRYDALAGKLSRYGLVSERDATIDSYVTDKALNGLFMVMAREEQALRKDPVGQGSRLLQKVLGALGH